MLYCQLVVQCITACISVSAWQGYSVDTFPLLCSLTWVKPEAGSHIIPGAGLVGLEAGVAIARAVTNFLSIVQRWVQKFSCQRAHTGIHRARGILKLRESEGWGLDPPSRTHPEDPWG